MDEYHFSSKAHWTWKELAYAIEPAVFYTVLLQVSYSLLFFALEGQGVPGIILQGAASFFCLLAFSYRAFREKIKICGRQHAWQRYPAAFCYGTAVVMFGVACNQLISMTGLKSASTGYRHAAQAFYGNELLFEIAALCVLGPLVEELVYRGFVFQRLCRKNAVAAVVGSAAVFGVMHLNLVQGIYAFAIGLVLAYVMYRTKSLVVVTAAHMAVNLAAVLWTETDWLDFLNQDGTGFYVITAGCLALGLLFLSYGNQLVKK